MCHQADQRTFKFTYIGANIRSYEQSNVCGKRDPLLLALLLQDRNLGLEIRRLNVCDQSPLKSAAQTIFDLGKFFRRPVTRNHNLLHRLVQRVESMEELFLSAFLLRQELN